MQKFKSALLVGLAIASFGTAARAEAPRPKTLAPVTESTASEQPERTPSPTPSPVPTPEPTSAPTPGPVQISIPLRAGSHTDWMLAAGMDPANFDYVEFIVQQESGWNPNAVNPTSGACGLGQQLPCGKWAGGSNNPIAALVAMNGYVGR